MLSLTWGNLESFGDSKLRLVQKEMEILMAYKLMLREGVAEHLPLVVCGHVGLYLSIGLWPSVPHGNPD